MATCLNSGGNDGGFRTEPGEHLVAAQCHGSNVGPMGHLHRGSSNTTVGGPFIAFDCKQSGEGGDLARNVFTGMQVRRLTPLECERLQGFSDNYTLVPYRGKSARDGPRYRALGNSMAVPVMRWIGERIAAVETGTMKLCRRMRHSPRTAPPGRCSD